MKKEMKITILKITVFFSFLIVAVLYANTIYSFAAVDATFNYETGLTGAGSNAVTQTESVSGETLSTVSVNDILGGKDYTGASPILGSESLFSSASYMGETSVTFSLTSGKQFDLTSITLAEEAAQAEVVAFTSSKGAVTYNLGSGAQALFNVSTDSNAAKMQGITSFTVTAYSTGNAFGDGDTSKFFIGFDDIVLQNITVPDTTAPTVSSVGVPSNATYIVGQNLDFTVNFDEAVTVTGTPYIPVTLNTGGTVNASYVSGSGTSALIFRYTVVSGNQDADGIAVGTAIIASGGTLKDAAGNNATLTLNSVGSTAAVLVNGIAPTIASVGVPANATYIAGQNLDFTVNFSEAVVVNTGGGTPYIPVILNTGGTVNATYVSGSGTSALVFRYTVVTGNEDADGITIGTTITANGGTLKNAVGNNVTLTLNSIGTTGSVLVDAAAPTVSSVGVPSNGTYIVGQNLDFTVNFSEAVTVTGTPSISVTLNTGGTVAASYVSGSGTNALVFRYTVVSGNADMNGIAVGAATLNGGTIKDAVANDATLTLNSVGATGAVLVDGIAPTVSSVDVPSNGTYIVGQNLDFTVNFDEAVTVTGTPSIPVTLNTGGTVNASYVSGSGTSALTFRYTVVSGNQDADGIAVGTAIIASGGTLKDAAGNNATLTLNSVGSTAAVLVNGIAPTIASVGVPANATYIAGQNLDFTVNFSEAVVVNTGGGTPYIPVILNTGGTVNATYVSGSGTSALVFRYAVVMGNQDADGITIGTAITANGGTIRDAAGNNAVLPLNNVGTTTAVKVDTTAPTISVASLSSNNTYADINFTEGTYGAADGTTALTASKLAVIFTQNGGAAANAVISAVKKNDSTVEGSATDLTGGETTVRVFLTITGTPSGQETVEIKPANATSIYDVAGNSMLSIQTTGVKTLNDGTVPTAGGSGTITVGTSTTNTIDLSWIAGTDNVTVPAHLQYKVVRSTSNNIDTLTNAVLNGTTVKDWTANITSASAIGLASGTTYYFNVIVKDETENMAVYNTATKATTAQSSGGGGSSSSTTTTTSTEGASVIVNGEAKTAGNASTSTVSGRTVTTVIVDTTKLEKILETQAKNATVTIPVTTNSDVAAGVLTGQMVKNMQEKEATLEVKTSSATYTLPASEINIDAVSQQLGQSVTLSDIKVTVQIAEPSVAETKVVESAARQGDFSIVVPAVEFSISCTYNGSTVDVSRFNAYVERTIAIPDGVNPNKITTGIVVKPDGTTYHVPTKVTVIDGKYYAIINSRTNSTYTVVWHPIEFADVSRHWAKAEINDMGSRMVVNGVDESNYAPNRDVTRAEFAAIIVRALGLAPGTGLNNFSDVKSTDWSCGYVETAASYGIINGYNKTTFAPNDKITREQAMTMIARAMKITGLESTLTDSEMSTLLTGYTDATSMASYAKSSIASCLKTGVVSGTSSNTLAPKNNITRAEVAVIMGRLLQKSDLI